MSLVSVREECESSWSGDRSWVVKGFMGFFVEDVGGFFVFYEYRY